MRCINRQYKYFHLIEYLKLEADINRNTTISYQSDITFKHAKYGYFEVKCIPNVIKRHQRVFVNINSWNREILSILFVQTYGAKEIDLAYHVEH